MMDERFQPKNRTPTRGMRLKRISAPMDNLNTATWYLIQWSGSIFDRVSKKGDQLFGFKKVAFCIRYVQDGSVKDFGQV